MDPVTTTTAPESLARLAPIADAMRESIGRVISGKPEVIEDVLTCLFAEGHLLLEDVPGVGKTMIAKALGRTIEGSVRRIQFTPDLLPSDITGVNIFNQDNRKFEFRPGAVFAHIVLGDEINRASPKTQSALLECMEERQVTVDGTSYLLANPFMVIATQNPIEMEGTYPLPEAQRDRFMMRISMGYPSADAEVAMIGAHQGWSPLADIAPVTDTDTIADLCNVVKDVYVADALRRYAVDLASATRMSTLFTLGVSPRATLHLVRAAKSRAALAGRHYVLPDDLAALAPAVFAHRLSPTIEVSLAGHDTAHLVRQIVNQIPIPRST